MPGTARRQHDQHARQTAARMIKNLNEILADLEHGRSPGSGWPVAVDGMSLYGQLTALAEHEEIAAAMPGAEAA